MIDALRALDRLNQWARSSSWTVPTRAIYRTKSAALYASQSLGLNANRLVYVDAKCHTCGGSGRYVHESGDSSTCRRCEKGLARLVFVESTIAVDPPIRWHSPTGGSTSEFGRDVYYAAWKVNEKTPIVVPAEDWTVKLPGVDLEPCEAAELLCIAEERFPGRPHLSTNDLEWLEETGAHYTLHVGRWPGEACVLCQAPSTHAAQVSSPARRLGWESPICDTKHARYDATFWQELLALGPPPGILDDARIQRWMRAHPPLPDGEARRVPSCV